MEGVSFWTAVKNLFASRVTTCDISVAALPQKEIKEIKEFREFKEFNEADLKHKIHYLL